MDHDRFWRLPDGSIMIVAKSIRSTSFVRFICMASDCRRIGRVNSRTELKCSNDLSILNSHKQQLRVSMTKLSSFQTTKTAVLCPKPVRRQHGNNLSVIIIPRRLQWRRRKSIIPFCSQLPWDGGRSHFCTDTTPPGWHSTKTRALNSEKNYIS